MYAESICKGKTLNRRATTRRIGSLANATRQGLRVWCFFPMCALWGFQGQGGGADAFVYVGARKHVPVVGGEHVTCHKVTPHGTA